MIRPVERWMIRLVAAASLWMVFPGAMEATENLGHLLMSGHLAHAAENGDEHSDSGPEHGCDATLHLCSCHVAPAGLLAAPIPRRGAGQSGSVVASLPEPGTSAHLHNIEHPPQS